VSVAVVLDSHVLHWWSAEPDRISAAAGRAISAADELAVADITWFELAWLARHDRIVLTVPLGSWLQQLARQVTTLSLTPAIAATAVSLPSSFPSDPADRLIYATAIENGWRLITKDQRLRKHKHPKPVALW
jgi:PIN domain nuclease of toxin-antitoxin system